MFNNTLLSLILGIVTPLYAPTKARNWPVVQSVHERRVFVDSGRVNVDIPVLVFIKALSGVAIYKLECHTGDYEDQSEMNFSGDYQCAMFALIGKRRVSGNLLAANTKFEQSADYTNRGRMTENQLREPCGSSAAYGRVRRIRVRGMLVTIQFMDPVWNPVQRAGVAHFTSLTIDVSVVPDRSAKTPTAEPVRIDRDAMGSDLCG